MNVRQPAPATSSTKRCRAASLSWSSMLIRLVVAERFAERRGLRELGHVRTAELQRYRVLLRREAEQPLTVAAQHRLRRHHLGVQQRMPGQQAMEEPAMPIRPVHHRRDTESMLVRPHALCSFRPGVLAHPGLL
jgi:hypothetical protein